MDILPLFNNETMQNMKDILLKYPIVEAMHSSPAFGYPQYTLDLHGYTKEESAAKIEWCMDNAAHNKYSCVRIITGKGTGVLRSFTSQLLKKMKEKADIKHWKEEGVGVFLVQIV